MQNKMRRVLSLGVVLLATILVLTLESGVASAADLCRSDPILVLSNGKTLTLTVDVSTSLQNINRVDYLVTLPYDVTMVGEPGISADDVLVGKERVIVHSTGKSGEYKVQVNVLTKKRADVSFIALLGEVSREVEGKTGQALRITFR